jgi:type I restriction-modification system DNA methylase subunit
MAIQLTTIQENLGKLYVRWRDYKKNERQGYQIFLSEFFGCFGITFEPNSLPFEHNTGSGFADCYIKDLVIFEMKDKNTVKTEADLREALPQALKYWEAKGKHVPYLVLCNFNEFVIFDTRDGTSQPVKLAQLETRADFFNFLLRLNPNFVPQQEEISKESAKLMGELYQSLKDRLNGREQEVDIFVLQCLFCLFSEDIGYLPTAMFTNSVKKIVDEEDNSANILSLLFKMMDERDEERKRGKFEQVRFFNGPLFQIKPEIVLNKSEVELLWKSCQQDWQNVRPEIFGALFESSMSKKARHSDGMHFTSEDDILKIVRPCILDYWEEILGACKTEADFRNAHKRLTAYRVLDPACGSGNFLVVAYRELKRIEERIFHSCKHLSGESYNEVQNTLGWFSVKNMYGIEVNKFPSFQTRVALWITKKIVKNQFKLTEPDLPLEDLKHVVAADALEIKWDNVDVVIGNPPFIGCKQIREARGEKYANWLSERFKDHNKMSDYCTYWYEKVLEDVPAGVRVGLVSTNSVSQTNSREASLGKIVESGGEIFNAVSSQKWSGEAKVHVSIVNFVNRARYSGARTLDGESVSVISSRLLPFVIEWEPKPIPEGKNKAFQGVTALGKAFIINKKEAKSLIKRSKANADVIKKFISAGHVTDPAEKVSDEWIIDFQDWSLEKASEYKAVVSKLKEQLEKEKASNKKRKKTRNGFTGNWWRFWRSRPELRKALESRSR